MEEFIIGVFIGSFCTVAILGIIVNAVYLIWDMRS